MVVAARSAMPGGLGGRPGELGGLGGRPGELGGLGGRPGALGGRTRRWRVASAFHPRTPASPDRLFRVEAIL